MAHLKHLTPTYKNVNEATKLRIPNSTCRHSTYAVTTHACTVIALLWQAGTVMNALYAVCVNEACMHVNMYRRCTYNVYGYWAPTSKVIVARSGLCRYGGCGSATAWPPGRLSSQKCKIGSIGQVAFGDVQRIIRQHVRRRLLAMNRFNDLDLLSL